ncbi:MULTISPECIES: hypothetical protein [Actinoalloteichus]|uniref:hypothetical protein n=1 Tax=Actinoalloteichus TaxID=65496 RepID=UPI00030C62FC|nr:hypothetical protein [Actinoalloteichus spitiensis]
MFASVILWNLSDSQQTVASLRSHLREYAVEAYSRVPGLHQKLWVSSTGPEGEVWGALYVWESLELAYGRPPGVSRVLSLIGYPPTRRSYFSVEAATSGGSPLELTAGLGLAFASEPVPPLTRPVEHLPPGVEQADPTSTDHHRWTSGPSAP